jgi:PAS domain S-box-containing protein
MATDLQQDRLMREALVGAGTSVWSWDMEADALGGMDGSVALLGYAVGEMLPTQAGWDSVIHPDDRPLNHAAYLRHARGEIPAYESEYRARHKDGSWRWLSERGRIVEWWPDGRPRRMVGTLSDVTLRRQAQGEAAERDERLQQIMRHVPGVLYQYRLWPDGRAEIPFVSDRCTEVLGLTPQQLMGDALEMFRRIARSDREALLAAVSNWARSKATQRTEYRYHHPDGSLRWMQAVSSPRRAPDGSILWHGYLEDITEYRELEKARAAAATADAANRAKTEFLSRMSHELRTPLNAVLGFAQLLELDEEPLSVAQRRRVGLIRESGEHLLRMIGDLLDHTRIEAGQLSVESADIALGPLLGECLDMLAPQAGEAGVTLRPIEGAQALQVRADPTRLRQVVLNLLSNAVKYNRAGGSVQVRAEARGAEVLLQVIDDGIGIAAKDLPQLFEPFNRLAQARSGIQGTGIGLAITRALTVLMGGRIEVESAPGVGSTFSVSLPRSADQSVSLPT